MSGQSEFQPLFEQSNRVGNSFKHILDLIIYGFNRWLSHIHQKKDMDYLQIPPVLQRGFEYLIQLIDANHLLESNLRLPLTINEIVN